IFFFQAEDGIRDGHVTGVQTCAFRSFNYDQATISPITTFFDGTASGFAYFAHGNNDAKNHIYHVVVSNAPQTLDTTNHLLFQIRSEERRVGKEFRLRWDTCHLKKKKI